MGILKNRLTLIGVRHCLPLVLNICVSISFGFSETYLTDPLSVPIPFVRGIVLETNFCNLTSLDVEKDYKVYPLLIDYNAKKNCNFELFMNYTIFHSNSYASIKSWSRRYREIQLLSNRPSTSGYGLAVDYVTKKIYAISMNSTEENNELIVVDIQNEKAGIVLTDLNEPRHLGLDPVEGLLFIAQLSSILRANMDGTSLRRIVEKEGISELSVDIRADRIYWANVLSIESSNYDGEDRRVVVALENPIKSLCLVNKRLFWLRQGQGFPQDGTIWTCTMMVNGVCDNFSVSQIGFDGEANLMKAYDLKEMQLAIASRGNPCEIDNGGCQQLCLLTNHNKGHSCACHLGYRLNVDRRSCNLANDEFLLYVQGNFFKGRQLDPVPVEASQAASTFNDVIYPNRWYALGLENKKVINFDYDFLNNQVFHADDKNVFQKSLLVNSTFVGNVNNIATDFFSYDWVSRNTYCASSVGPNASISVFRKMNEKLIFKDLRIFQMYEVLHSLVVHPNRGRVYFTMSKASEIYPQIYQMNSDGTVLTQFIQYYYVHNMTGIGIDFQEERLYWFSNDVNKLQSTELDYTPESVISTIPVSSVMNPRSVNLYDRWAYVSNLTSVWRLDKMTGRSAEQLIGPWSYGTLSLIAGAKVYGRGAQPLVDGHPCVAVNGGCQMFCYALWSPSKSGNLRRQCGCDNGTALQVDGRTCV